MFSKIMTKWKNSNTLMWCFRALILLLLFIVAAVVAGLPPFVKGGLSFYLGDLGDARFCHTIWEHVFRSIQGKEEFFSPRFFYPVKGVLGYSDPMLFHGVVYSIFRFLSIGENFSFSLVNCSLFFINYLSFFSVAVKVFRFNFLSSALGSVFFTFCFPRLVMSNHPQLTPVFLCLWVLYLFLEVLKHFCFSNSPYKKKCFDFRFFSLLNFLSFAFGLIFWTSFYLAWYTFTLILMSLVILFFLEKKRFSVSELMFKLKNIFKEMISTVILSLVWVLPFLKLYLPVIGQKGWRPFSEISIYLPGFSSLIYLSEKNYIWGWLFASKRSWFASPLLSESPLCFGLVYAFFFLVFCFYLFYVYCKFGKMAGVFISESLGFEKSFFYSLLISSVLFNLFALPFLGEYGWQLVYWLVPGAKAIRAVGRYTSVTSIAFALTFTSISNFVLSNDLFSKLTRWFGPMKSTYLVVALRLGILLVLAEQFIPMHKSSFAESDQRIARIVDQLKPDCLNFLVTASSASDVERGVFIQIDAIRAYQIKGIPTVNGYSGMEPKGWEFTRSSRPSRDLLTNWQKNHLEALETCFVGL